jgi:hypothetical protein
VKRKQPCCGVCGELGHRSTNQTQHPHGAPDVEVAVKRKPFCCGVCGELGHRSTNQTQHPHRSLDAEVVATYAADADDGCAGYDLQASALALAWSLSGLDSVG